MKSLKKPFPKAEEKYHKYTNKAIENKDLKQKHKSEIFILLYNHKLCNLTLAFDSSLRTQLPTNRFSSLVSLEPRSPFSITEKNSYVEKM